MTFRIFQRTNIMAGLVGLIPLLAIWLLNWDLFLLLAMYWLECMIMALFIFIYLSRSTSPGALPSVNGVFLISLITTITTWSALHRFVAPAMLRDSASEFFLYPFRQPEMIFMACIFITYHGYSYRKSYREAAQAGESIDSLTDEHIGHLVFIRILAINAAIFLCSYLYNGDHPRLFTIDSPTESGKVLLSLLIIIRAFVDYYYDSWSPRLAQVISKASKQ